MSETFKNMTIRKKLLMYQGFFILLIFLLIAVYLITGYSSSLLNSEKANIENILQFLNGNLTAQVETINSVDVDVRVSSLVKENLNYTDYVEYGRAFTKITDFLSSKVFGVSGLRHAVIIDMAKHVYTVDLPLQLPDDFDLKKSEVYQKVLQIPSKLVWLSKNDIYDQHSLASGDYRIRSDIHAASIIKNYSTGETQGVLILTLNENFFKNVLRMAPQMDALNLYLVSPDHVKCYPLTDDTEDLPTKVADWIPNLSGKMGSNVINGELVTFLLNDEMGWYILGRISLKTLHHDVDRYIFPLLAIIGFSLLVFFAISNRVFNSMTKGIKDLSLGMRQFETGDFNVRIESPTNDEIGQLSQSFNHMAERIDDLVDKQYKMQIETREAEFRSLQAQINPHFLYNTLDMLNWQLVLHGEEKLSESVVAIGNCLRYSISNNGEDSTLRNELDNVKDYISIQTMINNKPISMSIDTEDEDQITLPKLTLQPLVENAVLHGFKGRDGNNALLISGKYWDEQKSKYIIEINDNGIGMTQEQINSVFEQESSEKSPHVGLANVISRLNYMYKDRVKVSIASDYGFGTRIKIILELQGGIR